MVDSAGRQALPLALHTPLLDLLGCEVPVMNAGMGGVARHELAAAVGNAGGFASLGMVREPVERIVDEVTAMRALCDRPFAVNLIPSATRADLLQRQVDTCLQLDVPAITLFWEVDQDLVRELKRHSLLVLHQVGSRLDAQRALRAGVDVLIAQGVEAGGHVRGCVGTMALVPELVAMSPVPVVASGGIASGAGLVAALALGAQGVSCGSLFLATHEANAHPLHQRRLCEARADDTLHTYRFYRNWPVAAATRVLPNSVTRGDHDHLRSLREPTIIGTQDAQPVHLFSTDSPLRDASGSISSMALYAGQSCGQIDTVLSVEARMRTLLSEASNVLATLHRDDSGHQVQGRPDLPASTRERPMPRETLVAALRELLAAERAGARTAAACHKDAYGHAQREQLRQLHEQEVRSCRALLRCLASLDAEPGQAVGDFYQKVMALNTLQERMQLIDKGQQWVRRRVEKLLAQALDDVLRQELELVLRYHGGAQGTSG